VHTKTINILNETVAFFSF